MKLSIFHILDGVFIQPNESTTSEITTSTNPSAATESSSSISSNGKRDYHQLYPSEFVQQKFLQIMIIIVIQFSAAISTSTSPILTNGPTASSNLITSTVRSLNEAENESQNSNVDNISTTLKGKTVK